MPSSGYSSGEMLRMQQDAIRRVHEMQRRANEKLEQTTPPPAVPPSSAPVPREAHRASSTARPQPSTQPHRRQQPEAPAPPQANEQTAPIPPQSPPAATHTSSPFGFLKALFPSNQQDSQQGFLARLGIDEEQAFLLLLIFLLYREGADRKLLLALAYLLL